MAAYHRVYDCHLQADYQQTGISDGHSADIKLTSGGTSHLANNIVFCAFLGYSLLYSEEPLYILAF